MSGHRWDEFGEIAVRQMGQVKPGEDLLILADTKTDMEVAQACLAAGISAEANAQLLVIPWMAPTDAREFNQTTIGAIQGADVIIGLCETMFVEKESTEVARRNGTRIAATTVSGMEDFAIKGIVDVDYEKMIEVAKRGCQLWENTKICQVTSTLGTDIHFHMIGRPALIGDGMATEPGEADFFPGVSMANAPVEETINGTIVIDGNIPPGMLVKAPVTCRLERGVIVDIKGGEDAIALERQFEESGDPIAKHLCHFTLGLNPRAKTTGHVHQDEHVLGAVTFGFGSQDPDFKGNVPPCKVHFDVVLQSPTIFLDDVVMCENNRLNPDLGLGGI
jgi:leucyl aminopeptidase (aminopeptidase T)